MKRPIASAFTANAISDYEHQVDETIIEFVHAATSSTEPIVLNKWLQWYAMDVLNRIAFSATPGFIEQRRDVADTLRSIQTRFFHWSSWGPLHTLNSLLLNIPVYSALRRQPPSPVSILAQAKLASRTAADTNVRQDLLQKYLDARKEHKDTLTDAMVLGLTVSTIAAGADTSGISILIVLYHVYRNPEVLHRLREEITDFKKQGHLSDPYKISETQKMPYLEIVVREALRVHTVVTLMLERLVPAGGLEVAGKYLPEGTVVGCSPWVIHQQESIYGPNPEEFKPERWFVDEEKRRMMDRFSLEFGAGKRVCIGKNIAKLNIYKIVPCIINDLEVCFVMLTVCGGADKLTWVRLSFSHRMPKSSFFPMHLRIQNHYSLIFDLGVRS
jgi:cytochrome P450